MLETLIATWRQSYRYHPDFTTEDLDELESHVRDHVAILLREGHDEEEAFRLATRRLGDRLAMEREYHKTTWDRVRVRSSVGHELRTRAALGLAYARVAGRNLLRRKSFATINIVTLAVGLACFLLIALWVRHETSFDRFHERAPDIYRVNTDWSGSPFATSSMLTGPALLEDIPEVEAMTRLYRQGFLLGRGAERFQEEDLFYADSSFFRVFDFRVMAGAAETALTAPFSVVLTERLARKYFGGENPVGQTLSVDAQHVFTVSAVVQDPPDRSHIQFDALVSMTTARQLLPPGIWEDWFWSDTYTYILTRGGTEAITPRLRAFEERRMGDARRQTGDTYRLALQPITQIHLHPYAANQLGPTGHINQVLVFSIVAMLILALACINFTNLSTARGSEREKEVGIRKSFGAARAQLSTQFLIESVLTALLALFVALLLVKAALPAFETLSGSSFPGSGWTAPFTWPVLGWAVVLTLVVGVVAGSWPAFVLSRFRPQRVLAGRDTSRSRRLRQGLVVFQFTCAIVLLSTTLLIRGQLEFLKNHNTGFQEERMLILGFDADRMVQRDMDSIRQGLLGVPGVKSVTATSDTPGHNRFSARMEVENARGEMVVNFAKLYFIDVDFIDTYGLELVAGRDLSLDVAGDHASAMLINESAMRRFGYEDAGDVLGKRYRQWGTEGVIVGVVKDFNFTSLHEPIRPLTLRIDPSEFNFLTLKLETKDLTQVLASVESAWGRLVPHRPFDWRFLDQDLDNLYASEARFEHLFIVFASLAGLIAALGLFGLASFTTVRRTREIGIRKALGATSASVVVLLTREFTLLVALALVVAIPIAWFQVNAWLQAYPYRLDISWTVFLVSGLATLGLAWLSVGHQAWRAARQNPVDGLRSD